MATVTLERLRKTYRGGVVAVDDLSLHILDGEFVSLVGPSGCGKSTTLNLLAGLEAPTSGSVRIDGEQVTHKSPGERDVAMVFQSYALYPHLSVRQNLAFPLENAGVGREELQRRVEETAHRLGLDGLLERRPRELSGGQRQRVALGRALVRRPKVFLFDEPLSNLDASLRSQVRAELKHLHLQLQATFVYVTHDQAEAMTLSDRVVVMEKGRVQQVAPPRELYAAPQNLFVASFFGSPRINLVPPTALGLAPEDVLLGVRAEHLRVSTEDLEGASVSGTVFLIEPMGSESFVTVEVQGQRLVARAPADFRVPLGTPVRVQVERAGMLRFDPRTRARLD